MIKPKKLIHGVGVNDADYKVQPKINGKKLMCPYYQRWRCMLSRCYSEKFHKRQPNYVSCSVVDEWHLFSNFKKWMEKQDWKGNDLDKDIIIPGNKIYGPDNCCFVTPETNTLLNDSANSRGDHPTGVYFDKRKSRFIAKCSNHGNQVYLGCFGTPEEASAVYKRYKAKIIRNIANQQEDIRIKNGLLFFAEQYEL